MDDDVDEQIHSPFDQAAAQLHREGGDDDAETSDLPEPTPMLDGAELDVEAEREYQRAIDRIIDSTKIAVHDLYRNEQIRRRKVFLAAEERMKAAVGPKGELPDAGEYDPAPKPATGFVVQAKGRRKGQFLPQGK